MSLQLRARYFLNSTPREFDYFSPKWYSEAIPIIQIRRFYDRWQYTAAFGWGVRGNAGSNLASAVLAEGAVISPPFGSSFDWRVKVNLTYSNTPSSACYSYNYEEAGLALTKAF